MPSRSPLHYNVCLRPLIGPLDRAGESQAKKVAEKPKESPQQNDLDLTRLPLRDQHPGVVTWAKIAGHNWWPGNASLLQYPPNVRRKIKHSSPPRNAPPCFGCFQSPRLFVSMELLFLRLKFSRAGIDAALETAAFFTAQRRSKVSLLSTRFCVPQR